MSNFIKVETQALDKAKTVLEAVGKKAPQALRNIVTTAARDAQKSVINQITSEYYINAPDVRSAMKLSGPSGGRGGYTMLLTARGPRRELIRFKVQSDRPQHTNHPQPIQVGVRRDDGLKTYPGGFVQFGGGGMPHVLKRVDQPRYPIHIKYGPSVPEMMGDQMEESSYNDMLRQALESGYERAIEREIGKLLGG